MIAFSVPFLFASASHIQAILALEMNFLVVQNYVSQHPQVLHGVTK